MMDVETPKLGQRIAVIGCSGSGKSTLAQALAKAKGIPYVNADGLLFCDSNWTERPKTEFYALIQQHLAGDSFTYDGNIGGSQQIVLPRIDTLIWLDYPRHFVMRRLLWRTIHRAWTKQPLYAGCTESWRMSFASRDSILLYAWRSHGKRKAQYEALWPTLDPAITKVRVRNQAQCDAMLQAVL
ncbi:MAG: AAA family ATPase [Planctomycetota bacterium]